MLGNFFTTMGGDHVRMPVLEGGLFGVFGFYVGGEVVKADDFLYFCERF